MVTTYPLYMCPVCFIPFYSYIAFYIFGGIRFWVREFKGNQIQNLMDFIAKPQNKTSQQKSNANNSKNIIVGRCRCLSLCLLFLLLLLLYLFLRAKIRYLYLLFLLYKNSNTCLFEQQIHQQDKIKY